MFYMQHFFSAVITSQRNYFIKNSPIFSSWFAGFFFGFTIDQELIKRIPNLDFSINKKFQWI